MIDALLQAIANYVAQLMQYIVGLVQGLLNSIAGLISNIINSIVTLFNQLAGSINSLLTGILNRVGSLIDGLLMTIAGYFINAWNVFMAALEGAVTRVHQFIVTITTEIRSFVETIVDTVRGWIEAALEALQALVEDVADAVVAVIEFVRQQIGNIIGEIIQSVVNAYDNTILVINASFDLLFQGARSIIETVNSRIGDLAGAFTEGIDTHIQAILRLGDEQFKPIREVLHTMIDPIAQLLDPADQRRILEVLGRVASPNTLALRTRGDAYVLFQNMIPASGFGRFAWMVVFGIGIILFVYSGIANANAQVILQEFSREYSWQVMTPADITGAHRRGKLTREGALELLGRHGFPQPQANMILDNADEVPAVENALGFWHRGLIGDQQLSAALFQSGLGPEWQGIVKQGSFVIPPVGDLITMAVKDAFSPDVAQRFGQFEDFPQAFGEWARKQGLTDEWARRYWAAHWGLPSVQMGYEMLHRGIISESDLDLLLRAQDVMPFWREKLKRISFATFTRVDIRRMHALGILDEAAVTRAYMDIGYDAEKAALMTQFTVQLNAAGDPDSPDDLGKLTRASILNFYGDGLLTNDQAIGLLVEAGSTPAAASLYVADVDFERERKNRNAEITLIVELADAGTITFSEAQDRLNALGLAQDEVNRAIAAIVRNQQKKTTLPTKAEGIRWYKKALITRDQLVDLLKRLGYADAWIAIYTQELDEAPDNG